MVPASMEPRTSTKLFIYAMGQSMTDKAENGKDRIA